MIQFQGALFDGSGSARQPVNVQITAEQLILQPENNNCERLCYPLSEIQVSSRLGNTARWLTCPDGKKIETRDNDAVDKWLEVIPGNRSLWLYRLESRWPYLLFFLLLVIGFSAGFTLYGLPAMARQVAFTLPAQVNQQLGQQTLEVLDQFAFEPTKLSQERQQQIQQQFQQMQVQLDTAPAARLGERPHSDKLSLLFRHSNAFGANAFALPSGTLIITDELVALAESDLELVAVLAHEIGHVHHRHGLRRAIQNSLLPLIIISITGDVSSATTLVASLPTLVLEASYSQQFEREADDFARHFLQQQGIPFTHFIKLLSKLEQTHVETPVAFLSTHPTTRERIQNLSVGNEQ